MDKKLKNHVLEAKYKLEGKYNVLVAVFLDSNAVLRLIEIIDNLLLRSEVQELNSDENEFLNVLIRDNFLFAGAQQTNQVAQLYLDMYPTLVQDYNNAQQPTEHWFTSFIKGIFSCIGTSAAINPINSNMDFILRTKAYSLDDTYKKDYSYTRPFGDDSEDGSIC